MSRNSGSDAQIEDCIFSVGSTISVRHVSANPLLYQVIYGTGNWRHRVNDCPDFMYRYILA